MHNLEPSRLIELNMVKLDEDQQVLFLFKEISIYSRLQKARIKERLANVLINSVAHNFNTPLSSAIQANREMSDDVEMTKRNFVNRRTCPKVTQICSMLELRGQDIRRIGI